MEETRRNPPIEESKKGLEKKFFSDLYSDFKSTPRHVFFWHLVGYAAQVALVFTLPEVWCVIQFLLFFVFIDIVLNSMSLDLTVKKTINLVPQSLFFLFIVIILVLFNAIALLFSNPIKLSFNFIKRFNNWIDNL